MKSPGLAVPALAALLATSCSSSLQPALSGTTGGWYAVTASETPFYRYGPLQGSGPDITLPHDSIMKVIRPSFGYVKVRLQDGQNGYVANEDIGPAAASVVADKLAPPPTPAPRLADQSEQFRLDSNDPRLIAPPEPLPSASPFANSRH